MSIRPDMIGIVVHDIERSLRFYRLLGLDVPSPKEGEPYVEITSHGYRISWNAVSMVKQLDPAWVEPVGHRMELAFRCDSPAHVDATYAKLEKAGYKGHKVPWDAFWGQRYAVAVDPDGNHVSLFAQLPKKDE
jgi:catechol 2,3-dioxygenase-like lactoylglutathione lyase family enzyme